MTSGAPGIEVYWGSGSPFAWRVLLTAALKQIPYTSHQLQFSQKDHKAPAYLALNDRGEVPVLRDGDVTLTESIAIMTYLDARFPDPPLFGADAVATAEIWRWVFATVYHIEPNANRIIGPAFARAIDDHADDMRAAAGDLHAEFARFEAVLGERPWLAGETVSAADIVAHTYGAFFLRIAARDTLRHLDLGFDTLGDRYPNVDAWRLRTTELPGYDAAYPPHWRDGSA
ncbi:MAG: glutathione S-transferase family protein [Pseudomonadota bacterium]